MFSAGFLKQAFLGFLSFAFRHGLRTPGMKTASLRWIFRIGDVALQNNSRFAASFRVRPGNCRQECLGVRVFRCGKKGLAMCLAQLKEKQ